jgi:hypothetical protein
MNDSRVKELRISLVWMETTPSLVRAAPPPDAPLRALGRAGTYHQAFDASRTREGRLEPPWPKRKEGKRGEHYFWYHYLEKSPPDQVKTGTLWKNLVPLRSRVDASVSEVVVLPPASDRMRRGVDRGVVRLRAEGFHYPHGIGLIVTITVKGDLDLRNAVATAVRARTKQLYEIEWGDETTGQLTLDAFAEHALERLRADTFGPATPPGARHSTPISIATLISGSGPLATERVTDQGDVHRALEALCSWSQSWRNDQLPPLTGRELRRKQQAPPGHLLYGSARARAVWYPEWFTSTDTLHKLGCYHRNQTLLALQTESLLELVQLASQEREKGNRSATLDELIRDGVGLLGRLYGKGGDGWVDSTYQSWSARKQIDSSAILDEIDRLRAIHDMDPLQRAVASP